jgi:hypothetical protein
MVGLATLVLAIGLLAAMPALAEEPAETAPMWQRMQQWFRGGNAAGERDFVDEDGDGVCDVCGVTPGEGARGMGMWGRGVNGECEFVDEDGDGVCDVCGLVPGEGELGPRWGRGAVGERAFVDEDGDGVCDVCGLVPGEGELGPRWQSEDGRAFPMMRGGMMRGGMMQGFRNR